MVLSECTQMLPMDRMLHAEILRQPNCHCIPLAPLSPSGVASLLADHLDNAAAERLAPACRRISGGNPLLAQAIVEDCRASEGAMPTSLIPGSAFRQAVSTCLYRCELRIVDLAQAIAVLAEVPSPALLGELLDVSAESASRGLDFLSAAGLLAAGRFRHDAARGAVLDHMSSAERAAMHGRAARIFYQAGAAPAVLAEHVVAADRVEAGWAVPALEKAAEEALAGKQPDLAIRYLSRAYDKCPGERWGVAIGGPLASVLLASTAARKHEEAAVYLRMPVPEAMFGTAYGLLYLHARGYYYLATDRLHAALADFQSSGSGRRDGHSTCLPSSLGGPRWRRVAITVSTVEQHLTRVYRKLRVSSRADLPVELPPDSALAGPGPPKDHYAAWSRPIRPRYRSPPVAVTSRPSRWPFLAEGIRNWSSVGRSARQLTLSLRYTRVKCCSTVLTVTWSLLATCRLV
jgi:hypothetical protein